VRRSTPSVGLSAAPLVLGFFFADSWGIIVGYLLGATLAAASRGELRQPATAFGIALVVWIPPEHFRSDRARPPARCRGHPVLRRTGSGVKTGLGA